MEEEISPLEYARYNQLSSNYLADRTGFLELESLRLSQKINDGDISDDSHLQSINFGTDLIIEERLNVTKDAAMLIGSAMCLDTVLEVNSHILNLLEENNLGKKLRCELPLLQSDHETDYKKFRSREDFEIDIQSVNLALEVLDEQKNLGLTWNSELWGLGQKLIDKLKIEKLCVSKEAILYLQTSKKYFWTSEDIDIMWHNQDTYKRSCCRDPVTPPLTPILIPSRPYQPTSSDSTYQIPLLSDPLSPTGQELKGLESMIFAQDSNALLPDAIIQSWDSHDEQACYMSYVRMCDINTPFYNLEDPSESFRLKREHLEVDETMTPEKFAPEYPKFTALDSILEVANFDPIDFQKPVENDNKFVEETLLPAYKAINQKIEQESLIEADILYRVDVPNMDFSKMEPPWKKIEKATTCKSASSFLQSALLKEGIENTSLFYGGSNFGDDNLRWNPFPQYLSEKGIETEIQSDNSTWEEFIPSDDSDGVLNSSIVCWKHERLKIVKEDYEDEERIDFCHIQEKIPRNILSLVKKRKLMIQEQKTSYSKKKTSRYSIVDQACSTHQSSDTEQSTHCGTSGSLSLLSGTFSACNAVDNYLKIRGSCERNITKCHFFHKSDQEKRVFQDFRINPQEKQNITTLVRSSPQENRDRLPAPYICQEQPTSVILASTLLERRLLINRVESLLPLLNIIERDFSAHKKITQARGCIPNTQNPYNLLEDADVIVSPTTGFILTTLQKIKQKPLPGHKAQSAIRARLNSICNKYENIVVFVSEGRTDEHTNRTDLRDCFALSELTGFTVSLFKFAAVYFIGGGEETLAQWLASFIQIYRVECLALLQEETHWEIFLRRAGLNAFAAQAVIADLKGESDLKMASSDIREHSGLMKFAEMNANQRMCRFGHLVGISVMEKVNKMIDSTWNI